MLLAVSVPTIHHVCGESMGLKCDRARLISGGHVRIVASWCNLRNDGNTEKSRAGGDCCRNAPRHRASVYALSHSEVANG